MSLHDIACHGLQPDLTICIDIDLETAIERARSRSTSDRIEKEAAEFHNRVRDAYLELARKYPERIKLIDGRGRLADVAGRIRAAVEPILKDRTRV
jgi:dTMP kinase